MIKCDHKNPRVKLAGGYTWYYYQAECMTCGKKSKWVRIKVSNVGVAMEQKCDDAVIKVMEDLTK